MKTLKTILVAVISVCTAAVLFSSCEKNLNNEQSKSESYDYSIEYSNVSLDDAKAQENFDRLKYQLETVLKEAEVMEFGEEDTIDFITPHVAVFANMGIHATITLKHNGKVVKTWELKG